MLVWQDFMFANLDYPIADEGFRAAVERRGGRGARGARRPAEPRGALRQQRGRAAGGDARARPRARPRRALRRAPPRRRPRRRARTPSTCPRRRAAARCRSAPTAASPTTSASAPTCARSATRGWPRSASPPSASRSPTSRTRPRSRTCWADRRATRRSAARAGRRACRATSAAAGTSTTCATTTCETLFGVDPRELRSVEPHRYLELSRAVSGEVMAEVFGEWRRAASPCGGGIVLWLRDLASRRRLGPVRQPRRAQGRLSPPAPGARPGRRLDHRRGPRRDRRPRRQRPARAAARAPARGAVRRLRAATRRGERDRRGAPPRGRRAQRRDHAGALRRRGLGLPLRPARAGPDRRQPGARPRRRATELLSQAVRFPAGRPLATEPAARLGLEATLAAGGDGTALLRVTSRRLAYGVRVHAPGFAPDDDAFSIEPGATGRSPCARARRARPSMAPG